MSNHVLVISAQADDFPALEHALSNAHDGPFDVEGVATLAEGLERILQGGIDAILLDLCLPDCVGLACFGRVIEVAHQLPILTLCEIGDEHDAKEAVQRGAQGWLLRDYFDNSLVPQALRNIIERLKVERRLHVAQARAEATLNSIGDGVVSTDMLGRIDYLNLAAERMTGWSRGQAVGRLASEVLHLVNGVTAQPVSSPIDAVLAHRAAAELASDTLLIDRQGNRLPIEDSAASIHDADGDPVGAVMVFRDVSRTAALASKMRHLAQYDFLTNLPNRALLSDHITLAITLARRSQTHPALLFLDLDKFKHINDSLGHAVGDLLLQAVSNCLLGCVRTSDTVSRHGGDEFVILLADNQRSQDAALAAEKILVALSSPFVIDGHELHTSTSIGISTFPLDGADAATLIKNADTAMYHAKERGRNNFQFFRGEMHARAVERQLIESNLRRALERKEFVLYFQPKVHLDTGRISGVEALLRWRHPEWGLVLPERFIHVAEECGLIIPMGRWVLREACRNAVRWRDIGITPVSIAINVSALEFRHRDFFDSTQRIIDATGMHPSDLQLELTESILMQDVASSATLLAKFKSMGVQIAVDDFGTGYSSLSYLNNFPIDVLKIDQSFVKAIGDDTSSNGAIVSAVIGLGKSLEQRIVAEGVETREQFAFLKLNHCNEGQGYWFSRPVGSRRILTMLHAGSCSGAQA